MRVKELRSQVKATSNSHNMVENQKQRAFNTIFSILDHDQDDKISASKIGLDRLPAEVVDVILPILREMDEEGHILERDEFVDALGRLYSQISVI